MDTIIQIFVLILALLCKIPAPLLLLLGSILWLFSLVASISAGIEYLEAIIGRVTIIGVLLLSPILLILGFGGLF